MPYLSKLHGFIHPSKTLSPEQKAELKTLENQFELNDEQLQAIVDKMHMEMERGLRSDGTQLLMIPSYVTGRPNCNVKGEYLALDFGGTNCRICLVKLGGNGQVQVINNKFKFSNEQLKEPGEMLFENLAQFIGNFLVEQNVATDPENPMKLGFTFSFPVDQTTIIKGTLVRWTKGFENPGVVGEEIAEKLQANLDKRNINVHVNALVNDTVGTLSTSSYLEPSSQMGLILGTGTNAAYYELSNNITKLPEEIRKQSTEMVINMEWGAFDNDRTVLPLTEYDAQVDVLTPNPREQTFEKTVSGFYLGEIFRHIVKSLHEKEVLFTSPLPYAYTIFGGVDTAILSGMLTDHCPDLSAIEKMFDFPTSLGDRVLLKKVAELVGRRAAQLAGAASSAVLLKRPELLERPLTVGVDGSVYEHFPYFQMWMDETVAALVGSHRAHNVQFAIAKDGSGIGAALISMIAHHNCHYEHQE